VARAAIGVGANLGEPAETIAAALDLLRRCDDLVVIAVSSLRETDPVGYTDQPRFVNGAWLVDTGLSARELLDVLLAVEAELGRERGGPRFGPRTIDLDLLLYDDAVIDEPGLTVPHPRLHERRFALEPLAELDPGLPVPGHGPVGALLESLDSGA